MTARAAARLPRPRPPDTWGLATDDLLAVRTAGGQHYYVTQDLQRSVRGLVKRDGTWVLSQRYGPYGAALDSSGTSEGYALALRYRWTGREWDAETGWYFFRSRYYDPASRRFVQEDAIGYAGGMNLYWYGDGDPTNGRNPDGLMKNYEAYSRRSLPGFCYGGSRCNAGGRDWDDMWGDWFGGGGGGFEAWWDAFFEKGVSPGAEYEWAMWLEENDLTERPISQEEMDALGAQCASGSCNNIVILEPRSGRQQFRDRWMGPNTLYFNSRLNVGDVRDRARLAHEVTHELQYREWGLVTFGRRAIGAHISDIWTDPYRWEPGRNWTQYGIEQQAQIVWYCTYYPGASGCSEIPWMR